MVTPQEILEEAAASQAQVGRCVRVPFLRLPLVVCVSALGSLAPVACRFHAEPERQLFGKRPWDLIFFCRRDLEMASDGVTIRDFNRDGLPDFALRYTCYDARGGCLLISKGGPEGKVDMERLYSREPGTGVVILEHSATRLALFVSSEYYKVVTMPRVAERVGCLSSKKTFSILAREGLYLEVAGEAYLPLVRYDEVDADAEEKEIDSLFERMKLERNGEY